jgi:hypothetical protein
MTGGDERQPIPGNPCHDPLSTSLKHEHVGS